MFFDRTNLVKRGSKTTNNGSAEKPFSAAHRTVLFEQLAGSPLLNLDEYAVQAFFKSGKPAGWFLNYGFESAIYIYCMGNYMPIYYITDDKIYTLADNTPDTDYTLLCDRVLGNVLLAMEEG